MAMSEAKKRSNKKWYDANRKIKYDTILLVLPKGRKQTVKDHAAARGVSVNGLVNSLLWADMGLTEKEWKDPPQDDE